MNHPSHNQICISDKLVLCSSETTNALTATTLTLYIVTIEATIDVNYTYVKTAHEKKFRRR